MLFQYGHFALHSGVASTWKIDCDALTDHDIDALAHMIRLLVPTFSTVEGVPRGGTRLATCLSKDGGKALGPLLIVDDVLTTGASMEQQRAGRPALGVVIFARGLAPLWVTPLFHAAHQLSR